MSDLDIAEIQQVTERQRRVERISQAAIELRPGDTSACFLKTRSIILSWLAEKARGPLPSEMLSGTTSELSAIGAQRVETVALETPRYWTARQDDMDQKFAGRTWVTEAALAPVGQSRVIVGHRLHCVTLGDPAPFSRSIPKFMREIARNFDTYLDGSEISLQARKAETSSDVEQLVKLLCNKDLRHPVLGVSTDRNFLKTIDFLIDPDALSSSLFGVAHVWSIAPDAAFELSDLIGKELSVFHGGVRSWRFPLSLNDNMYNHPLATARHIVNWGNGRGVPAFRGELTDWALRFSAGRSDADKLLPSFAEVRRVAAGIARDKAKASGASDQELLRLALEDNERMFRELGDQIAEHKEIVALADVDIQKMRLERDEALQEANRLRGRLASLEIAIRSQRNELIVEIPETLGELENWSQRELGDAVYILPRAFNLAKKSPFEDVEFVYRTILTIRDKYASMRRTGSLEIKNSCDDAWRELGLELIPTPTVQNRCAQSRIPIEMMCHG